MPGLTPSSPPNASGTVRGLVSTVAQTFAGPKTFLARIVATLGITSGAARLDLRSDLGAGASDVCSVVGSTVADGSVSAAAKLLSLRTGLGATEVEKVYWEKNGAYVGTYIRLPSDGSGGFDLGLCRQFGNNFSGNIFYNYNGGVSTIGLNTSTGRIDQRGTDSGAAPGAASIDRPVGINAIASGASSVTITNSLVAANSRVMVTFHADHGAARWWVTRAAGSFTVNLSAAATANAAFSWEVSSLL